MKDEMKTKLHPLENQTSIKIPKKYLDRVWAIEFLSADESSEGVDSYMLIFQDDWCVEGTERSRLCISQKEVLDDIRSSEPYLCDN
ncbi:MAG: hypothetical protein M0R51_15460 [Clostridia bacterium]|jgi:hypothetical protein|nr:hypothetical protein [Clostridia bacterium]